MENENLLLEEHKGCRHASRGTKDQLLIDNAVIGNCKSRKTNLNMAWVDFKKGYDMVPHTWIIKGLKLIGAAPNVIALLKSTMIDWESELTSGDINLGEVNIKRGIFQRDFLSPLLSVVSLVPLTLVLRRTKQGYAFQKSKSRLNHLHFMDDLKLYRSNQNEIDSLVRTVEIGTKGIGMKFGRDKCGVLAMKRRKEVEYNEIEFENGEEIGQIGEEGYKYLGILEKGDICPEEIKEKIRKEYFKRLRTILKSKLNVKHASKR